MIPFGSEIGSYRVLCLFLGRPIIQVELPWRLPVTKVLLACGTFVFYWFSCSIKADFCQVEFFEVLHVYTFQNNISQR